MSVVGIDLGTLNSVIAVARNRGVDVVSDSLLVASVSRDQTLTAILDRK
jgi:molecular chaperone DnaK (HSP70)